jgi:hypothetical protein
MPRDTEVKVPNITAPDFIADRCRNARLSKTLSRLALAKLARVATRSITTVETKRTGKRLSDLLRRTGDEKLILRQRRLWARSLARLALALDEDPQIWLQWFEAQGNTLLAEEVNRIISDAMARVRRSERPAVASGGKAVASTFAVNTLREMRETLKWSQTRKFEVDVCFLTSSPHARAQTEFYQEFLQRVFGIINPRLAIKSHELKTDAFSFKDLMEGLSGDAPRFRVVIGPYQMVGRSAYQVRFIPIPGWRIRLAALVTTGHQRVPTWDAICRGRTGDGRMGQRDTLRILTIGGEAGDVYLRGFHGYSPGVDYISLPGYDPVGAANQFYQMAAKDKSQRKTTVLVIGEYEAARVRQTLAGQLEVVDVAARRGSGAPRYQLAMATGEGDRRWFSTLNRAVLELFKNSSAVVGELYGKYIVTLIEEAIADEEARTDRPSWAVLLDLLGVAQDPLPRKYADLVAAWKHRACEPRSYLQPQPFEFGSGGVRGDEFQILEAVQKFLVNHLKTEFSRMIRIETDGATRETTADESKRMIGFIVHRLVRPMETTPSATLRKVSSLQKKLERLSKTLAGIMARLNVLGAAVDPGDRKGGSRQGARLTKYSG